MHARIATRSAAFLIGILAVSATRFSMAADPPTPAQALSLRPMQPLVEYTIPTKEEATQCAVKLEKENKISNWVVTNRQGEILRRFCDTNADNYVDMWCYFLNGVEVYRDIDSNFNNKADQYRWFNSAGTRWAIDKNEDGKIDSWKVISPHEVAEQVVLAIKNRDPERFALVLLTPNELSELGFGQARIDSIAANIKAAPAAFSTIVDEQKVVTAQSRYVDFTSARPGTIPSGTAGSTKDVTICDNATALIQSNDKHDQVFVGTLVNVGDTWRLVDVPGVDADRQPAGAGFAGAIGPGPTNGGAADNGPNEEMQKLMAELERLDKASDTIPVDQLTANMEQRVNILQSLAEASPEKDRDQWYRQMADVIGMAIQAGNYPAGAERLDQLQKKLTDEKADEDLIAHVTFQRMWSLYAASQRDPAANREQIQVKWLADLQAFVNQFPKSADAAEALFQLAIYQEFMGKSDEAAKSYQQLVENFPKAGPIEKAKGALRRLQLLGKPIALRGSDIHGGGTIDLAKYRNKVVLIHYWTSIGERWKEDMVLLRDAYAKKAGKDFDIIGVCLDDDPVAAKRYIAENKLPWKQIYERGGLESRLATEMGVITLPLMILVDQKGNVANQNVHIAELDTELARLAKPAADTANALRGAPTSR
jgi:tetratricopeptide (TPR) repeat protein